MSNDAPFKPRLVRAPHEAGGIPARRALDSGGPALRLVENGKPGATAPELVPAAKAALLARQRAIARENHASSMLDAEDARGIVAARVAEALEGGRAGVLRPERRRKIVTLATRLGLRPFDANLIIAIVQDGARRGAPPHDPDTHGRLRLIDNPAPPRMSINGAPQRGGGSRSPSGWPSVRRGILVIRAIAATLLGVLIAGAMIAWVIGLF